MGWILRTILSGKRRDIGLGGLTTTSLAKPEEGTDTTAGLHVPG
jgi:hypothetical protein